MLLMSRRKAAAFGLALLAGCGRNRPVPQSPTPALSSERILVSGVPAPNQVIKIGMTQDLSINVVIEGRPMGPMNITGRNTFSGTQRTHTPDAQGHLSVELTIDEMSSNMNLNGQASPFRRGRTRSRARPSPSCTTRTAKWSMSKHPAQPNL